MCHISPAAVPVRIFDRITRLLHKGDELRYIAAVRFYSSRREMPDILKIGDILFQSLFLHMVFTFSVAAGVETAPGFLVPLHHEVSAVWAYLLGRLVCTYEIALRIVGASIEFPSLSAMLFPCHNLAVAARARTFAEWDRLGVLALWETGSGRSVPVSLP